MPRPSRRRACSATLRPYQRDGLAWLQFLRGLGLGGVLADDMGLGKTVQTLAHILAEKEAGRLDRARPGRLPDQPGRQLAPRGRSASRPDLRVLVLHGTDRAQRFDADRRRRRGADHLRAAAARQGACCRAQWHLVVLDEAQAIKNPASKVAQLTARLLRPGHRLCLSGTPMENHLGELWSLISFLMPGLLGDHRRFRRVFRNPIEKQGDAGPSRPADPPHPAVPAAPHQGQVAAELPPKTEILRQVELTGDQRDLYESVRLAMHERVREEIAAGPRAQPDRHPGGAAQAAPGLLRPAPGQARGGQAGQRPAPSSSS